MDVIIPALTEEIKELENIKLPDPDLLNHYKLRDNRIFWIDDDIDYNCIELSREIQRINIEDYMIPPEDRKPIKIFIFSDGGSMYECFSLVSAIEQSVTPVWTINAGIAFSAAGIILLSGSKRFAYKRSEMLIHSGSGSVGGTFEQTDAQMNAYKNLVSKMFDFVLERTNIDKKTLNKKKNKDWFISDEEQVELGIVDKIVDSIDELL